MSGSLNDKKKMRPSFEEFNGLAGKKNERRMGLRSQPWRYEHYEAHWVSTAFIFYIIAFTFSLESLCKM